MQVKDSVEWWPLQLLALACDLGEILAPANNQEHLP